MIESVLPHGEGMPKSILTAVFIISCIISRKAWFSPFSLKHSSTEHVILRSVDGIESDGKHECEFLMSKRTILTKTHEHDGMDSL